MKAQSILNELRELGAMVEVINQNVQVKAPVGLLTDELKEAIASFKMEIINLLESEVAWRVEAMRRQIPNKGYPLPLLFANELMEPGMKECHSCGDLLHTGGDYLCSLCRRAKYRALAIHMT